MDQLAALGGVVFGWLGDRIGRVRAMALSILAYSLVTGLGYFATAPWHLAAVRFISALGMGGQWSLGVALVMECWPERWRPMLAGGIGAAANVGFLLVGATARLHQVTPDSWRWMLVVAALPAFLVVFIIFGVPESERWRKAAAGAPGDFSPMREVFRAGLRSRTLLAIGLASIALIGTWGSVQWLPSWANKMVNESGIATLRAEHPGWYAPGAPGSPEKETAEGAVRKRAGQATADIQMIQGLGAIVGTLLAPLMGAIVGTLLAPLMGARLGRRPAYFLLCLGSLLVCGATFRTVHAYGSMFLAWGFVVSLTTASFYGWFPLYFPELFPTRVRATGQGLSYNFGRVFAAVGAVTQGQLVASFGGDYARAGAVVTLIYLVGMGIIWLAPETRDAPLPD